MEREFMKWTENLKKTAVCAIDHKFTGQTAGFTDRQQELKDAIEAEKQYWEWTKELKTKHQCGIDQAWTM